MRRYQENHHGDRSFVRDVVVGEAGDGREGAGGEEEGGHAAQMGTAGQARKIDRNPRTFNSSKH